MKFMIGDDPLTEKETHLIHSCHLDVVQILFAEEWVLCLVFEEIDLRTILPMTRNLENEDQIREVIELLTESRDKDETAGSSDD